MIQKEFNSPENMWFQLGLTLFDPRGRGSLVDVEDRNWRALSYNNNIRIRGLSPYWENKRLLQLAGYSLGGSKLNTLWNTYVNQQKLEELNNHLTSNKFFKNDKIAQVGMPFNTGIGEGKGCCLSAIHFVRNKSGLEIYLQAKILEFPKQVIADIHLCCMLAKALGATEGFDLVIMAPVISFSYVKMICIKPLIPHKFMVENSLKFDRLQQQSPRFAGTQANLKEIKKKIPKFNGIYDAIQFIKTKEPL